MKRLRFEELSNTFEREVIWPNDEIWYFSARKKKSAVLSYHVRLDELFAAVCQHSPGRRVADLASAQANLALLLAEAGYEATAVDIRQEFLDYARKKHIHGQIDFVQANLMEYQSAQAFDCVVMGEIIEHVAYPDQLLASAARNLRPGGVLILSTPNGNLWGETLPTFSMIKDPSKYIEGQFHWKDHLFLYTEVELRALLQAAGFKVREIKKIESQWLHQLKAIRYLLPLACLRWLERRTRHLHRDGKDRAQTLIAIAEKV